MMLAQNGLLAALNESYHARDVDRPGCLTFEIQSPVRELALPLLICTSLLDHLWLIDCDSFDNVSSALVLLAHARANRE